MLTAVEGAAVILTGVTGPPIVAQARLVNIFAVEDTVDAITLAAILLPVASIATAIEPI